MPSSKVTLQYPGQKSGDVTEESRLFSLTWIWPQFRGTCEILRIQTQSERDDPIKTMCHENLYSARVMFQREVLGMSSIQRTMYLGTQHIRG